MKNKKGCISNKDLFREGIKKLKTSENAWERLIYWTVGRFFMLFTIAAIHVGVDFAPEILTHVLWLLVLGNFVYLVFRWNWFFRQWRKIETEYGICYIVINPWFGF